MRHTWTYFVILTELFCLSRADEILVNAADNFQRDNRMNCIQVEIVPEENLISVWNNGAGIPIEIHKEHNIYVPEMIFGKCQSVWLRTPCLPLSRAGVHQLTH